MPETTDRGTRFTRDDNWFTRNAPPPDYAPTTSTGILPPGETAVQGWTEGAPSPYTPSGQLYQPQVTDGSATVRAPYGGWNNAGDETNYLRELADFNARNMRVANPAPASPQTPQTQA